MNTTFLFSNIQKSSQNIYLTKVSHHRTGFTSQTTHVSLTSRHCSDSLLFW